AGDRHPGPARRGRPRRSTHDESAGCQNQAEKDRKPCRPHALGAYAPRMRILLVSQMYPGPDAPDLGTFVAQVERELAARGHEIEPAVLDTRAGGKLRYLTRELETKLPEAQEKVEVVSSGVDREMFAVTEPPPGPPGFLCVGALDDRKNVLRLAEAFARLGEGTLTFAGDGPLRSRLEGRNCIRLLGRVAHDEIPRLLAECRVLAQPSLVEPLGQALLEAMACGRSVVA